MPEQTSKGPQDEAQDEEGLDTRHAHSARVYNYWLGGKDNFAADREAAEQAIAANPGIVGDVRANRAFLVRVVRSRQEAIARYLGGAFGEYVPPSRAGGTHSGLNPARLLAWRRKEPPRISPMSLIIYWRATAHILSIFRTIPGD